MIIDILTLFPEMFEVPMGISMMKKAQDIGAVGINIHNLRDWAEDKHKTVDGRPFGGGKGMVLRVDVVDRALNDLRKIPKEVRTSQSMNSKLDDKSGMKSLPDLSNSETLVKKILKQVQDDIAETTSESDTPISKHQTRNSKLKNSSTINDQPLTILLSPQGPLFTQSKARALAKRDHIILIAGHYEGFDERIRKHLIDEELSIGEYVLTGGELPAMVVTDSVVRLLPGVLDPEAIEHESFSKPTTKHHSTNTAIYDFPTYTRPADYKGWKVPEILLSGNHAEIERWRKKQQNRS